MTSLRSHAWLLAGLVLGCNLVFDIHEGTLRAPPANMCPAPPAATGKLSWAETSESDYAVATAVAAGNGRVVVAGSFSGHFEIDGTSYDQDMTDMLDDMFVVSLDAETGSAAWAVGYSGIGESVPFDVAVDRATGDAYVVGTFDGELAVEETPWTAEQGDTFLIKLDRNGDIVWTEVVSGPEYQEVNRAVVDANGDLIIAGYGRGPVELGPDHSIGGDGDDVMFLAKLDAGGNVLWSRSWEASTVEACPQTYWPGCSGIALAVDDARNVYFGGGTYVRLETATVQGGLDAFVMKLDAEGTVVWDRIFAAFAGDSDQWVTAVAADCSGDVYIGGGYRVALVLDDLPALQAAGTTDAGDAFLARLDANGNAVWAKGFTDLGPQTVTSLATDGSGDVVLGAILVDAPGSDGVDFGGELLVPAGDDAMTYREDFAIARFGRDGSHRWSQRFGDEFIQEGKVVAGDDGAIVAAGDYFFSIRFDGSTGGTLESTQDSRDLFAAVFDP